MLRRHIGWLMLGVALLAAGWECLPRGQAAPPATSPLTISFVGDILLAGHVGEVAKAHGSAYLLAPVKAALTTDDLTIGNLECVVATHGTPEEKEYTFRADPVVLPGLRAAGIDAVTVANNHTLDFGRDALLETLDNLRATPLPAAGAGKDAAAARKPLILTADGRRVALVAASRVLPAGWHAGTSRPGIAGAYDPARLAKTVAAACPVADVVVVYLHWGVERAPMPEAYQRQLAYRCIDAGADLVIGSHPHVLQGFEYYKGKLIAYSLGNFVFTNHDKSTAILQTTFTDAGMTAKLLPCTIVRYRPTPMRAALRGPVFAELQRRSFRVRISADGVLSPAP